MECAAALANFARCGLQFQAYIKKHDALPVLAEAAEFAPDPSVRFHVVRALAEFSLDHKWLVLLIAEGCVNVMLATVAKEKDLEIVMEATRFLGNLATSKVGREAVVTSSGVQRVVNRLVKAVNNPEPKAKSLAADLVRTASNLCVSCKEASQILICSNGINAFLDAYAKQDGLLDIESFRGLLIVAQAGHKFRASVLREIGIRIRHDTASDNCVAHLYDLSRRIKVEASAEKKDDFPTTIAGLGERSKQYLFQAGPLAREDVRANANSVPDMPSPAVGAFRQSARLLSVQRPVLHRDRLQRERRERIRNMASEGKASPLPAARSPARGGKRPKPRGRSVDRHDYASPAKSPRQFRSPNNRVVSEPSNLDHIPTCKVINASGEQKNHSNNWVMAVVSAVCNAISKPNKEPTGFSSTITDSTGSDVDGEHEDTPSEDVYEIGVPLGRGGFATVFLAKNLRSGDLVAVKRFHPISASTLAARKKAEIMVRRAIKEQRIWDGLFHKNIVSYRGCFFGETGELNLVAEYIPGWSLADHLSQISKFPEHMVARITLQIVDGLAYLHRCGVTHRDVKPANILVDPTGVIKITDFGVSSAVDVPTMTGNTLVGTPWYIAPEMIEGRPYGKSVDIWSLGCTVIELATGRRPYHSLRADVALFRMTQDRMPPIPKKLSPPLRDFLKTCWVWDPAQRPSPAHLRRHPFLSNVGRPEISNLKNLTRKA